MSVHMENKDNEDTFMVQTSQRILGMSTQLYCLIVLLYAQNCNNTWEGGEAILSGFWNVQGKPGTGAVVLTNEKTIFGLVQD